MQHKVCIQLTPESKSKVASTRFNLSNCSLRPMDIQENFFDLIDLQVISP